MPARRPLNYDRLTDETMFYYGLYDQARDPVEEAATTASETEAELLDQERLRQDITRQFRGKSLPGIEVELLEEFSDPRA